MRRQSQKSNLAPFATTTWLWMLIICFFLLLLGFYLLGRNHGSVSCKRATSYQFQQYPTQKLNTSNV